jgi:hypothetical protein
LEAVPVLKQSTTVLPGSNMATASSSLECSATEP